MGLFNEILGEKLEEGRLTGKVNNRHVFLSLKEEISEAIEKGLSKREVWQHLTTKKKITVKYRTFCEYVQNFNTEAKPRKRASTTTKEVKEINQADVAGLADGRKIRGIGGSSTISGLTKKPDDPSNFADSEIFK